MYSFSKLNINDASLGGVQCNRSVRLVQTIQKVKFKENEANMLSKIIPTKYNDPSFLTCPNQDRIQVQKCSILRNIGNLKTIPQQKKKPRVWFQDLETTETGDINKLLNFMAYYFEHGRFHPDSYSHYFLLATENQKVHIHTIEQMFIDKIVYFYNKDQLSKVIEQILEVYEKILISLGYCKPTRIASKLIENYCEEVMDTFLMKNFETNYLEKDILINQNGSSNCISEENSSSKNIRVNLIEILKDSTIRLDRKNSFLLNKIPKGVNIFDQERLLKRLLRISRNFKDSNCSTHLNRTNVFQKVGKSSRSFTNLFDFQNSCASIRSKGQFGQEQQEQIDKWNSTFGDYLFEI